MRTTRMAVVPMMVLNRLAFIRESISVIPECLYRGYRFPIKEFGNDKFSCSFAPAAHIVLQYYHCRQFINYLPSLFPADVGIYQYLLDKTGTQPLIHEYYRNGPLILQYIRKF